MPACSPRPSTTNLKHPDDMEVVELQKLAHHYYNRFKSQYRCVSRLEYDDALQEAFLGILDAKRRWNPEKGSFCNCAYWAVFARLWRAGRRRGVIGLPVNPHLCNHPDAVERAQVIQHLTRGSGWEPWYEVDLDPVDERLSGAIDKLKPKQRDIVLLNYFEGVGLTEIGRRLGIRKQRVVQLRLEALANLRYLLRYDNGV